MVERILEENVASDVNSGNNRGENKKKCNWHVFIKNVRVTRERHRNNEENA
jgi:hypothetical protein